LSLHRWGVKFGMEEGTFGPLLHAKFHPHRCNVSPLRGEKPQNRPLSKLNTGRFALRAMLPVIIHCSYYFFLRLYKHILANLCSGRGAFNTKYLSIYLKAVRRPYACNADHSRNVRHAIADWLLVAVGVTLHRPEIWRLATDMGCERCRREPRGIERSSSLT